MTEKEDKLVIMQIPYEVWEDLKKVVINCLEDNFLAKDCLDWLNICTQKHDVDEKYYSNGKQIVSPITGNIVSLT